MCIDLLLSTIIVSMFHDPKLPIPSFAKTSTLTSTLITHPSLIIFHDDDVSNLWTQIPTTTTTTLLANNITRCHCCTWTTCMLLLHPLPIAAVAPNHLRVSCHSKLQRVSVNVLGLWNEQEELSPHCYSAVARVWTFGGCWSGGIVTATRGVSSLWALFNPSTLPIASLNAT